ncbi:MAG: HD domain-containing protein [Bacteroidota bacterium]
MNTDTIEAEIVIHVKGLFNSYNRPYLLYHNLTHSINVVRHAREIAEQYKLDRHSLFVVLSAAWFHDTGQLTGDMAVHEETSVQFMKEFFSRKPVDQKIIDEIAGCIMATKMPVKPASLTEEILCDADTYHLGTENFQQLDKLVWKELELRLNNTINNQAERSLAFLEDHQFFTVYCLQLLSAGKKKNIDRLKNILGKSTE